MNFVFVAERYLKDSPIQSESPAAASLKSIVTTLKIGKPPSNIPVNVMFEKINSRLTEVLQKCGE